MAAFYKYIKGYMSDGTTTQYIFFNQSGEKDDRPYFSNVSDATVKHYLVSEDGNHTFSGTNTFSGENTFTNKTTFEGTTEFAENIIPNFKGGIKVSTSIQAGTKGFTIKNFKGDSLLAFSRIGSDDLGLDIATFKCSLTSDVSVTAPFFNASSDRRLKTNINPIENSVLPLVISTPVYTFNYKKHPTVPVIGIMAQDVLDKNINDFNLVKKSSNNYYEIKESKMIYILWKAVQEQQKQIEALQARLEGEVNGEANN